MSRAFTKEDDAGAAPLVAPRAPLPPGTTNYVTARGLAALHQEHADLMERRAGLERGEPDAERARLAAAVAQRIVELEARIGTAELVGSPADKRDEVRFGATVTLRNEAGKERTVRIVGVDEADAGRGSIAFVAPLARAVLGKKPGDTASVRTPHGEEEVEVIAVGYDDG